VDAPRRHCSITKKRAPEILFIFYPYSNIGFEYETLGPVGEAEAAFRNAERLLNPQTPGIMDSYITGRKGDSAPALAELTEKTTKLVSYTWRRLCTSRTKEDADAALARHEKAHGAVGPTTWRFHAWRAESNKTF